MDKSLKKEIIEIAKRELKDNDKSHDIYHALRVLKNAELIAKTENCDLDILIPAAIFHDVICYPKNSKKSKLSSIQSANRAVEILKSIESYPKEKLVFVYDAIEECSFKGKIKAKSLESKILQDSDRLEATGTIAIMRTFASAGSMDSYLYNFEDPFCENREPDSLNYALDLFFNRLLIVKDKMNTQTAKNIADKRSKVLNEFINSFKEEIYY